jgi:hypothetical protein
MKDFRFVGRLSASSAQAPADTAPVTPAAHQRLVLLAIRFAALGFLAAGIVLISGLWQPFPPDIARIVGFSFVASAFIDFGIIAFLRRAWSKPRK